VRSWRGELTDTVGTLHFTPSDASKSGLRGTQDFLGPNGDQKEVPGFEIPDCELDLCVSDVDIVFFFLFFTSTTLW
jgi:hypothetical protein